MFNALVFLGKDGKHLHLDSLHLVIELLEARHLAPVPMYLGLQRVITHFDQCRVDVERFMPGRQDLTEVVITVVSSVVIVLPGSCVNLPPLCWPL